MGKGRWVLVVTCSIVAVLAASFLSLQWDQANRLATSVSALAGVAAVGVAVWAVLSARKNSGAPSLKVKRTGNAEATGDGRSNTGIRARRGEVPGDLDVRRSGDATSSGRGDASSGIDLT